jgi:hypothetical protein
VPRIQKTGELWARNNVEKANKFSLHLEKRFHPNSGLDTLPVLNANDYMEKIPLATPRTVAEAIRTNLNPRKMPGVDLITWEIFKNFKEKPWSNYVIQCLHSAKLYSKCMENC